VTLTELQQYLDVEPQTVKRLVTLLSGCGLVQDCGDGLLTLPEKIDGTKAKNLGARKHLLSV